MTYTISNVLKTRVLGIAAKIEKTTAIINTLNMLKVGKVIHHPKSAPKSANPMNIMNARTPNPQRTAVSLIMTSTKFFRTSPALRLIAFVALRSSATMAGIVK